VAFQGLLSGTASNQSYLTATLSLELSLAGTPSNGIYLLGTPTAENYLQGTLSNSFYLQGTPAMNELEVIDIYDYFRTEDNLHFLVTEDSNYLVI